MAGRYRIESLLGHGGFGRVHRAFDQKLERVVALKVLTLSPERTVGGGKGTQRFEEEARAVARLDHPHIVPVYDAGTEGQIPWMVMKLIEGASLRAILHEQGFFAPPRALLVLIQVAEALSHAHRYGIVHRDVKPANILVAQGDGAEHAWLADFGIAKTLNGPELTQTGRILGTPNYMAPEQATGKTVDARADIFSLGCIAGELVTGRPAFHGDSFVETLHAIVHKPPDLDGLRERAGRGFEVAVQRCLEKSPEARWQTMDDLLQELETLATAHIGKDAERRIHKAWRWATPHRKWWLWLVTAGVLSASVLVNHLPVSPARKIESGVIGPAKPARMHLLRGEILDAETLQPLSRVLVSLPELGLRETTDDQGQYSFEVPVPAGAQVKLRATREGYEPINSDPPAGSGHLDTHRMWRKR